MAAPRDLTNLSPGEKLEQERRDRERANYEKICQEAANEWVAKHGMPAWKRIGEDINAEKAKEESQLSADANGALSSDSIHAKLIKPGMYHLQDPVTLDQLRGVKIKVGKDGSITPQNQGSMWFDFKKSFSTSMDMLVYQGATSVKISFDSANIKTSDLINLINMAQKRNLAVEIDENTEMFLSKLNRSKSKEIYDMIHAANAAAKVHQQDRKHSDKGEFANLTRQLEGTAKLDDAARDQLKTDVFANCKNDNEKIAAITDKLDELDKRTALVEKAEKSLIKYAEDMKLLLGRDDVDVDKLQRQHTASEHIAVREKLIDSIDKEKVDIEAQRVMWQGELDTMKQDAASTLSKTETELKERFDEIITKAQAVSREAAVLLPDTEADKIQKQMDEIIKTFEAEKTAADKTLTDSQLDKAKSDILDARDNLQNIEAQKSKMAREGMDDGQRKTALTSDLKKLEDRLLKAESEGAIKQADYLKIYTAISDMKDNQMTDLNDFQSKLDKLGADFNTRLKAAEKEADVLNARANPQSAHPMQDQADAKKTADAADEQLKKSADIKDKINKTGKTDLKVMVEDEVKAKLDEKQDEKRQSAP